MWYVVVTDVLTLRIGICPSSKFCGYSYTSYVIQVTSLATINQNLQVRVTT